MRLAVRALYALALLVTLAVLAAVILTGCGPASPWTSATVGVVKLARLQGWPAGAVELGEAPGTRVRVFVSAAAAADGVRAARILAGVAATVRDFERVEGLPVPASRLGVTDLGWFGDYDGNAVLGQWFYRDAPDVVVCTEGRRQELPALYHELVHRSYALLHRWPNDDPRWATWNAEDVRVSAALAEGMSP